MRRSFWSSILFFYFLLLFSSCSKQLEHNHTTYEHISFTSSIEDRDCFLCGNQPASPLFNYLGQINLGIIDLNTFDVEPVPIFQYTPSTDIPVAEASGVIQFKHPILGETKISMMTNADRGYAEISIDKITTKIEAGKISSYLCQNCLDTFSAEYFVDDAPASLAVVDFSNRIISPLIACRPSFFLGDYLINCDFEDNGKTDLLLVYCPSRFA